MTTDLESIEGPEEKLLSLLYLSVVFTDTDTDLVALLSM